MKDITIDKIVKALNMYRDKANIAFFQKLGKKKSLTCFFPPYTHIAQKIFPKLIVSLIWSQKLKDSEAN